MSNAPSTDLLNSLAIYRKRKDRRDTLKPAVGLHLIAEVAEVITKISSEKGYK